MVVRVLVVVVIASCSANAVPARSGAESAAALPEETIEPTASPTMAPPPPWPPNAQPGGTYVVPRSESSMTFAHVYLPNNFTLKLADDVTAIDWQIEKLEFGTSATIDLSLPSRPHAASGATGADAGGQAGYGQNGAPGGQGGGGAAGITGRPLHVTATQIVQSGSLWIRTDGGHGGAGGIGGRGQLGSGSRCGPDQSAGPPGQGGSGGPGGRGGASSDVTIIGNNLPVGSVTHPTACPVTCTDSARPPNTDGDDGRISIWGAPGCGGAGGSGGAGGPGDNSRPERLCRHFPGTNRFVRGRTEPGPAGPTGSQGELGACGAATIKGPPPSPPPPP